MKKTEQLGVSNEIGQFSIYLKDTFIELETLISKTEHAYESYIETENQLVIAKAHIKYITKSLNEYKIMLNEIKEKVEALDISKITKENIKFMSEEEIYIN